MFYIPCTLYRWWEWDTEIDNGPIKFKIGLGFFHGTPKLSTYEQILKRRENELLKVLELAIPMEAQVYEALGYRDLSLAAIKYLVNDSSYDYPQLRPTCTVQTALNRLMRLGKVTRVLHTRGWFRWYVYCRIDD